MPYKKQSSLYGNPDGNLGEIELGFGVWTSNKHWIRLVGQESYKGLLVKRLDAYVKGVHAYVKSVHGALHGEQSMALALALLPAVQEQFLP
jgi:hypothetical protein